MRVWGRVEGGGGREGGTPRGTIAGGGGRTFFLRSAICCSAFVIPSRGCLYIAYGVGRKRGRERKATGA